ncbi:MAG: hypothetical protein QM776_11525 [Rhodocyclaceae bacterium]
MNRTALLIATFLLSTQAQADTPPAAQNKGGTCCHIDDRPVSAARFDAFVRDLKMIPGTQLNAESPRGLYTSYKATAANGKRYLITLDGPRRTARLMPD